MVTDMVTDMAPTRTAATTYKMSVSERSVMRGVGKSYLLLVAGLVLAVAAGAASYSIVYRTNAPARSLQIPLLANGFAEAGAARALFAAQLKSNEKAEPGAAAALLARQGFGHEPLAAQALPVLVRNLAANGEAQKSARFLELAGKVTRRNKLVNAMLIDREVALQRPEYAVVLLGRAMAVSNDVRSFYIERLALATANPKAMPAFADLLGGEPEWAADYWSAVLRNSVAAPQAGELRLRIAGPPWNRKTPRDTDFELIAQLASRNYWELASNLSRALGLRSAPGSFLTNADFARVPRFIPFDWESIQTGEVGSSVEKGSLVVSGLPGTSAAAARQMIALPGSGFYRLDWKLSGLDAAAGADVKFRLSCPDQGRAGGPIAPVSLSEGAGSRTLFVPPSACRWYWATVELDTSLSDAGVDLVVDRLALVRSDADAVRPTPSDADR